MKKSLLILLSILLLCVTFLPVLAEDDAPLDPADWQIWPVIPTVSERAIEIYQNGLANGSDPHAFTKIADCQNVARF